MARKGRKQLTVLIKEGTFAALERIKEETDLSNAKIIEMLIENYVNTNININTEPAINEEILRKILKEELSCININTNINTEPKPFTPPVQEPIPTIEPEEEEDQSAGGLFHVIPKTHKVGKPEKMMKQYHEGNVSWMILEGCRAHFDKAGKPIPFRFTGDDGKVWEPDLDDLQELADQYGKTVVVEQ